jgi:V/A-type H+/Na+-transporting ATPase subunit E
MSSDENIETLSRAILSDAQDETEQVKSEALSKADAIKQRAQAQAEAERKAILEQATQEAERLRSQALATTQLKARALELEHREKLLERVFKAVREQLPSIQQKADYDRIAIDLVREGITQLNAKNANLHADKTTQKTLMDHGLDKISGDLKASISFGTPLERGTGVIVETAEGRLNFDNTLETRLNRLQNELRSSVYRLLVGESE